jgi:hypothetical protein
MRRLLILATVLSITIFSIGTGKADKQAQEATDVLEGVLKVHPKFHYRYYIDGFGNGQSCALFKADDTLREIKPGTRIRVRGDLASKFFGNRNDKMAALVSTWIIYMDVDKAEVIRQ